jgi:hypothetical protein
MTHTNLDWTHTNVKIIDIRRLYRIYVISINKPDADPPLELMTPLFVKDVILKERLESYFLKDMYKISREEILSVSWNMYITKGYYIKINERGETEKFEHDLNKWYISYLEIAGLLGSFCSIYREKEFKERETRNNNIKKI